MGSNSSRQGTRASSDPESTTAELKRFIDQAGAQAAFKRLGFMPEAVLADYVEDRNGTPRDLVIMSYDVDGFTDQADEPIHL